MMQQTCVSVLWRRGLAVLAIAIASPAVGEVTLESMENRIGKMAAEESVIFDKPKGTCVCMTHETPGVAGRAGLLRRVRSTSAGITRIRVDCRVVGFDEATGDLARMHDCADFIVLPK